jgi:hypothetical protein
MTLSTNATQDVLPALAGFASGMHASKEDISDGLFHNFGHPENSKVVWSFFADLI